MKISSFLNLPVISLSEFASQLKTDTFNPSSYSINIPVSRVVRDQVDNDLNFRPGGRTIEAHTIVPTTIAIETDDNNKEVAFGVKSLLAEKVMSKGIQPIADSMNALDSARLRYIEAGVDPDTLRWVKMANRLYALLNTKDYLVIQSEVYDRADVVVGRMFRAAVFKYSEDPVPMVRIGKGPGSLPASMQADRVRAVLSRINFR